MDNFEIFVLINVIAFFTCYIIYDSLELYVKYKRNQILREIEIKWKIMEGNFEYWTEVEINKELIKKGERKLKTKHKGKDKKN